MEYIFAKEAAVSLGLSGKALRLALDALARHDERVAARELTEDAAVRAHLVSAAGAAYWQYVVQRELLGLMDPEYIAKEYGVPREVLACAGAAGPAAR